jgi:hypothetical protein
MTDKRFMKFWLLGVAFVLLSCTHHGPYRRVAEDLSEFRTGEVNFSKSLVQVFPSDLKEGIASYYIFVQLRDTDEKYVDVERREFSIRTLRGEEVDFKFERVLPGRFYLTIEKEEGHHWQELNLFLQGRPLKEQFIVQMKKPHRAHSKIIRLKNMSARLTLRLELKDRQNRPVEVPEWPEISVEGEGVVQEIVHMGEGVWEFTVIYPNENQIIYVSVRAGGVFLRRLYRYQHIEK